MRGSPAIRVSVLPDPEATEGAPASSLAGRVLSFSYEDTDRGSDRCTLSLRNDDLFFFEAGEEVLGGQILSVSWGYGSEMAPARRVVVKRISGGRVLEVEADGLGLLLHREERARAWAGRTRSEIAREIGEEHGFRGALLDVEDTSERIDANQIGQTDAAFLRGLAAREGFSFWIDDLGFHWRSRGFDAAPSHVFTYGAPPSSAGGIIDFAVESNLIRRVGKVAVVGRDPLEKRDIRQEASADSEDRDTLGELLEVVDPDSGRTHLERINATRAVRPSAARSDAEAKREASARFRKAEREAVRLSLTVEGDPSIRAKALIEVRGLTAMINGLYYIRRCTHEIGSGYVCQIEAVRDSLGALARRAAEAARPQTGKKNDQGAKDPGEPEVIERIDPDTGRARLEFRSSGAPVVRQDPEARR